VCIDIIVMGNCGVYRHCFSFADFLVSGRENIFLLYSVQSVDFLL
jgi:hypothetical protein